MPRHVTRFPDGQLAVFSTIVDAYLMIGSESDVREFLCRDMPAADADRLLQRGLHAGTGEMDGHDRLRSDLSSLVMNRSRQELQAHVAELKLPPEWVEYVWQQRDRYEADVRADEEQEGQPPSPTPPPPQGRMG